MSTIKSPMLKSPCRGKRLGQSTVEYLVLVTAVIGVVIAFLVKGSTFQTQLCSVMTNMTNQMGNVASRLTGSF
jgi:hypothetical protein